MSFISVISRHCKSIHYTVIINRKPARFLTGNIPRKFSNIEHENMRTIQTKKIINPGRLSQVRSAQSRALDSLLKLLIINYFYFSTQGDNRHRDIKQQIVLCCFKVF